MSRVTLTIIGVVVVALGIVAFSAMFTVHQTEQVLVLEFGNPRSVITEPGLHFKLPFVQNVITFDRRILGFDAPPEEIIASDQKRLVVDSFVRYRITKPLEFYKAVRDERTRPKSGCGRCSAPICGASSAWYRFPICSPASVRSSWAISGI